MTRPFIFEFFVRVFIRAILISKISLMKNSDVWYIDR